MDATGFAVNSTLSSEALFVQANPGSTLNGPGGALLVQPTIAIYTPAFTSTPTPTITFSPTVTGTFTYSPTTSPTPSITPTWTNSPVAVEEPNIFAYPNPFDMQKFDKVTFRFPADPDARLTIFNLAGEPVREIPSSDIQGNQGFAIWRGQDDYMRPVSGGMYYVRLKGRNNQVKKFTVFR
jgi:hypothetical protein